MKSRYFAAALLMTLSSPALADFVVTTKRGVDGNSVSSAFTVNLSATYTFAASLLSDTYAISMISLTSVDGRKVFDTLNLGNPSLASNFIFGIPGNFQYPQGSASDSLFLNAGTYGVSYLVNSYSPNGSVLSATLTPSSVSNLAAPGPVAGAGLPVLAVLGGLTFWRRARQAQG